MKLVPVCVMLAAVCGLCACSPPSPADQAAEQAALQERIATVINLNGHLCAKVEWVGPVVSTGEYQVNCQEYRDRTKAKTKHNAVIYMVNPDTKLVRLMGRA